MKRESTHADDVCAAIETPQTSEKEPDVVSQLKEGALYGHSHTGIGAIVLTTIAAAKTGIGHAVRIIVSKHW